MDLIAFLIDVIGGLLNNFDRVIYGHSNTGKKTKSLVHTLLFLSVEMWAVAVTFVILGIDYFNAEQESAMLTYLKKSRMNGIDVAISKKFRPYL